MVYCSTIQGTVDNDVYYITIDNRLLLNYLNKHVVPRWQTENLTSVVKVILSYDVTHFSTNTHISYYKWHMNMYVY